MNCICGNKKEFDECCGAIISGEKEADTPEELMRSRYSAYVKGDALYLVKSSIEQYEEDIKLIEEFSNSVEWLKLDVLNAFDDIVEFKAYYRDAEAIKVLHEESKFILKNDMWIYESGELFNSKVERNESCPCGSGKKYKKCCA